MGTNFIDKGEISILVTNLYPPRTGIQGIRISTSPGNFFGFTDANGELSFDDLPAGNYTLHVEHDAYASVDTTLEINAGEIARLEIPLNGLPSFSLFEVNSIHLSRWFPPPEELFSLEIRAIAEDIDGVADIDSIWVVIEQYSLFDPVSVEIEPGIYVHTIASEELPVTMEALLGQEIQLVAKDRGGALNFSVSQSLVRVIHTTPLAVSPQELNALSNPQPTFTWEAVTLEYPFTYQVDVVQFNQNVQRIIQTIRDIPSTATSIEAQDPFAPGDYFWTVSVVDEFGNRSRSREAGFRIE